MMGWRESVPAAPGGLAERATPDAVRSSVDAWNWGRVVPELREILPSTSEAAFRGPDGRLTEIREVPFLYVVFGSYGKLKWPMARETLDNRAQSRRSGRPEEWSRVVDGVS